MLKKFILIFILIFFIATITSCFYSFNFSLESIETSSKLLFFDHFFDEFSITFLLLFLFIGRYIYLTLLGLVIFIFYISVYSAQIISLKISGEFLTKLALDNVEFIGLMVNQQNIETILITLLLLILLPLTLTYFILKKMPIISNVITSKYFVIIIILMGVLIHFNSKYLSQNIIEDRDKLYRHNKIEHTAPIQSLVKVLKKKQKVASTIAYVKEMYSQGLLDQLGFNVNPVKKFPFKKNFIYKENKFNNQSKPNIILIFTEGYSARTCNVYNKKFNNLTPNLVNFADNENSMVVYNYFNHTAPTYRGLHGQLCSLYPEHDAIGGWLDSIDELPKVNYKCLPHILQHNGYDTTWLNMHYADSSANDEMISHFGFNQILSAEILLKKYIPKTNGLRTDFLTDQTSYKILINYLKEYKSNSKPFMLGMYTVETHAWIDILNNGIKYQDGKYNSLNTIHNMDNAFGNFWEYFKSSKYANNTIVIFTSDHAHYYEKSYLSIMKQYKELDYKKIFIDQVPLIVYDPVNKLPKKFIANSATSLDLAPTISQLMNIKNEANSFMGNSIFEEDQNHIGISSYEKDCYIIINNKMYDKFDMPKGKQYLHTLGKKFIDYTRIIEASNRLIDEI